MNEEIKAVADRLIGLREIMDVSVEEAAGVCNISADQYRTYESGKVDIPVGVLQSMAHKYGIDLGTLISGNEPHMHSYSLTKRIRGFRFNVVLTMNIRHFQLAFKTARQILLLFRLLQKEQKKFTLIPILGMSLNI